MNLPSASAIKKQSQETQKGQKLHHMVANQDYVKNMEPFMLNSEISKIVNFAFSKN